MRIRLKRRRLARELARKRISLNRWGQLLGLGKGHLSLLLSGKRRYPSPETRRKLLDGLDVSFEELFEIEARGDRRHGQPFPSAPRHSGRGGRLMRGFSNDIRFGFRQLAKRPAWTLAAVLTLALGIGAYTAVFSAVYAILLHPMPFPDPDRLVAVGDAELSRDVAWQHLSRAEFQDIREGMDVFESLAAFEPWVLHWTPQEEPLELTAGRVSPGYFETLGVRPSFGRTFTAEDAREGRVVVVSERFFENRLGGSAEALRRPFTVDGENWRIIGMMPSFGISHPVMEFVTERDVWFPLPEEDDPRRSGTFTRVIARLRANVTPERAEDALSGLADEWVRRFPEQYAGRGYGLRVRPLQEWAVRDVRPALWAFSGAVGFLFLLICLNLANLQLARAEARSGEIALRIALGAGRARLARQFAVEGALVALAAAAAGVLLAAWGLPALRSLSPDALPRFDEAEVGWASLAAACLAAAGAALVWSLALALRAWGRSFQGVLGTTGIGRGSMRAGSARLRSALVVAQIALALLLLVGAGLMLRSFERVMAVDPGFETDQTLGFRLLLGSSRYQGRQDYLRYFDEVLERLGALPGTRVGLVSRLPLSWELTRPVTADLGRAGVAGESVQAAYRLVHGDYFRAMGIELLQGRVFQESDRDGPLVAIVDERLASRLWPGSDPLGQRFKQGERASRAPWRTVVGVVRHVKHRGLEESSRSQYYIPLAQSPRASSSMFVVVGFDEQSPQSILADVRQTVWSIDRDIPLSQLGFMAQRLSDTLQARRFMTSLFGIFSVLGLALGALGLFGLISYAVSRRVREIGVRLAVGAGRGDILRLIVGKGMALCGLGLAVGLLASFALGRCLSALLFQVSPADPIVLSGSAAFFALAAALAAYLPARRASRIDPAQVLRQE